MVAQAYGAGKFKALGLSLQLGLGISTAAVALIFCVWTQLGSLLLLAGARWGAARSPATRSLTQRTGACLLVAAGLFVRAAYVTLTACRTAEARVKT